MAKFSSAALILSGLFVVSLCEPSTSGDRQAQGEAYPSVVDEVRDELVESGDRLVDDLVDVLPRELEKKGKIAPVHGKGYYEVVMTPVKSKSTKVQSTKRRPVVVTKAPNPKGPVVPKKAPIHRVKSPSSKTKVYPGGKTEKSKTYKPIVAKRILPQVETVVSAPTCVASCVQGSNQVCGKHCFRRVLEEKKKSFNIRPVPARSYNKRTYIAPAKGVGPKIKTRKPKKYGMQTPVAGKSSYATVPKKRVVTKKGKHIITAPVKVKKPEAVAKKRQMQACTEKRCL